MINLQTIYVLCIVCHLVYVFIFRTSDFGRSLFYLAMIMINAPSLINLNPGL